MPLLQAIGLLYSTLAIGVVLGPPIGGMLYTQTGSYVAGFATASASWFAAALLFVPVLWRNESLLRGRRHPQS